MLKARDRFTTSPTAAFRMSKRRPGTEPSRPTHGSNLKALASVVLATQPPRNPEVGRAKARLPVRVFEPQDSRVTKGLTWRVGSDGLSWVGLHPDIPVATAQEVYATLGVDAGALLAIVDKPGIDGRKERRYVFDSQSRALARHPVRGRPEVRVMDWDGLERMREHVMSGGVTPMPDSAIDGLGPDITAKVNQHGRVVICASTDARDVSVLSGHSDSRLIGVPYNVAPTADPWPETVNPVEVWAAETARRLGGVSSGDLRPVGSVDPWAP